MAHQGAPAFSWVVIPRCHSLKKFRFIPGDRVRVPAGLPEGSHFWEFREELGPVPDQVRQNLGRIWFNSAP